MARPGFTRMWTVQEVALSREAVVICLGHEISWQTPVRGAMQIARLYSNYEEVGLDLPRVLQLTLQDPNSKN
jgi:hypothetical protein